MPRVVVTVESTIGSSIHRQDGPLPDGSLPDGPLSHGPDAPGRPGGWPVGKGCVQDTLDGDGRPVQALVLMQEPALPGGQVTAWPVAVLHLDDGRSGVDEVVCVAEAEPFVDLVDTTDLGRWHAEPGAWAAALARLSPGSTYQVTACGKREEAEQLVAQARHSYLHLTGCLD